MPRHGRCMCDDCIEKRTRRQEIRHGGVTQEEIPRARPGRRSKNKRWCKGEIGREHTFEWKTYMLGDRVWYHREECSRCGKHRNYKYPGYYGWDD